jgi:hypothetical protein
MNRKFRPRSDPIELAIELALNPGAIIRHDACFAFVCYLDEVAAKIVTLVASEPARSDCCHETRGEAKRRLQREGGPSIRFKRGATC